MKDNLKTENKLGKKIKKISSTRVYIFNQNVKSETNMKYPYPSHYLNIIVLEIKTTTSTNSFLKYP